MPPDGEKKTENGVSEDDWVPFAASGTAGKIEAGFSGAWFEGACAGFPTAAFDANPSRVTFRDGTASTDAPSGSIGIFAPKKLLTATSPFKVWAAAGRIAGKAFVICGMPAAIADSSGIGDSIVVFRLIGFEAGNRFCSCGDGDDAFDGVSREEAETVGAGTAIGSVASTASAAVAEGMSGASEVFAAIRVFSPGIESGAELAAGCKDCSAISVPVALSLT